MSQHGRNLYVRAQVGGENVGFPVTAVREIIHVPPIVRVPRAPHWLRGVTACVDRVSPSCACASGLVWRPLHRRHRCG